jgi:hypothetical protein
MVMYVYNHSYSSGRDQEDHSSRPAQTKKLAIPHLNKQYGCGGTFMSIIPTTIGVIGRRIALWAKM